MTSPAGLADRLEALAANASKGPWQVNGVRLKFGGAVFHTVGNDDDPNGPAIWAPWTSEDHAECFANAHLVAETVTALPTIIAALRQQEKEGSGAYVAKPDQPRQAAVEAGEASWVARIAEVVAEGDGHWLPCSGCQESVDGCVSERDYPYSAAFRCQPGGGCGECGGLGVLWADADFFAGFEDFARESLAEDRAPSRLPAPSGEGLTREAIQCAIYDHVGTAPHPWDNARGHGLTRVDDAADAILALANRPDGGGEEHDAGHDAEGHVIVARIWKQLGSPSHDELAGRTIYDLIDKLIADSATLTASQARVAEMQGALRAASVAVTEAEAIIEGELSGDPGDVFLNAVADFRAALSSTKGESRG